MSTVVSVTRTELEDRRRALLDGLGMTLADFQRFAATRTLTGGELEILDELDEIAFLLGE